MAENTDQFDNLFQEDLGQLLREDKMQYLLINVIAKRARNLRELGGKPLAYPANGSRRAHDIAAAEIYEGKLKIVPRRRKSTENEKPILTV